jgi:hypothetical protein
MADNTQPAAAAPTTAEGFLADRLRFWTSATKFMTNVIIALAVLLALLWWFLV